MKGRRLGTGASRHGADSGNSPFSHLVEYVQQEPTEENALSLFDSEWTSVLPGLSGPGTAGLFNDDRIHWLIERLGNVENWDVLELGPLEGGHTYMLEKAGAEVLAIESNTHAFLRCLIVKNLLNLRAKFLLGDFMVSLGSEKRWDLVMASGVLYHTLSPVDLLTRLAGSTDRLFLWTHYWEPDITLWHPSVQPLVGEKWLPQEMEVVRSAGFPVRLIPQEYGEALAWSGFCGGPESASRWIHKEDLLGVLGHLGFGDIQVAFDAPDHPNGPSSCFLAQRL
jgi:hypothetical protein